MRDTVHQGFLPALLFYLVIFLAGWGAVQVVHAAPAATYTVTNNADSGAGSLRDAVASAGSGDTIIFDAGLSGQTITLSGGEITINKDLTIDGSALAEPVTISGNNASRIFNISSAAVTLDRLRLVDGNADQSQGGALYILGSGHVDIIDSTFANNFATFRGGAIYNATSLDVTGSTFVENESGTSTAGAIVNDTGTVTITNTTFTRNAGSQAGALMNENNSTMYVYNSTFVDNSGVSGASIGNRENGTMILANNIAAGSGNQCYYQSDTITSIANWFEHGSCSATYTGNPYLAALDDNGGPTETHALMPFSGVAGAGGQCPAADQRGVNRAANCDLGAFEVQTDDYQNVCRSGLAEGETYIFGSTGISTTVDTLGSLTQLCVTLVQSDHPNATTGLQTGLYWDVSATAGSTDWSLTISAPATFTLDGSDKLCRYPGGVGGAGWDCGDGANTTTPTVNRITRSGITQLSDWAVGNNVGPTTVTLAGMHAASRGSPWAGIDVAALGLVLGLAGLFVWRRRR